MDGANDSGRSNSNPGEEDGEVETGVAVRTGVGEGAGVGARTGVDSIIGRSVGASVGSGTAVARVAEGRCDATVSGVRVGVGTSVDPLHATARNATAAVMLAKRPLLA